MHPLQLAQVACTLAAAHNTQHVWLLSLTEPPIAKEKAMARAFTWHLSRRCHISTDFRGFSNTSDLLNGKDPNSSNPFHPSLRHQDGTLFLAQISLEADFGTLNELLSSLAVSQMPGTIVVRQELLTDAVARLSWQLNNKIILLTHNTSSVSAWDIYRASPSLGARVLHLGSSPSPTLTQHWAADNGPLLTALGRDPWYRRTNLTGLVLRCSVLPYKPFSDITLHSDGTVTVRGLIGDLWDLLQSVTGFTGECRTPKDGLWGAIPTPEGRWEGILGEVHTGEADVGMPYLVITEERLKIVEFSTPIGMSCQNNWIASCMSVRYPGPRLSGSAPVST